VVAALIRVLGDFDAAEDAVQEAFAVALERWPADGIPANPGAWVTRVARNAAIDRLRRERTLADKTRILDGLASLEPQSEELPEDEAAFPDDRLSLIFTCCHPAIAPESRVALTLRTLGGLSTAEIARAFLSSESAMAQRLVRTKRKIRDAHIRYEVPDRERMPERLPSVTATLYLIYNEGYLGTASDQLLREELSAEAIRLTSLLAAMLPDQSEVLGLLALMLLTDARGAARVDSAGELVLLGDQDRTLWDRDEIERGLALARRAGSRGPAGPYTVQAAIAAEHARAATPEQTDWARIARLYLWLAEFDPSPVVELNRSVAVAEASGPEAGLAILAGIEGIDDYQPLHVVRADLLRRIGDQTGAASAYTRAIELSSNPVQRSFLERRLSELTVT
jgi:RNA polymerase sigma-70 factor (ECF subfamily)